MHINWRLEVHDSHFDELQLRTRPLREAWESRGPGLLRAVEEYMSAETLVDVATIIPKLPTNSRNATHRTGAAFPDSSSVTIDAVLVNPHPNLTEVVRLGWLLLQLQPPPSLSIERWQRATVPIVLHASQHVELARCDLPTLTFALQAWDLEQADAAPEVAQRLWQWWLPISRGDVTFDTALGKLSL